jgi:hypothetical protein
MTYTDPATLPVTMYLYTDDTPDRYSHVPNGRRLEIYARPLLLTADGTPRNPDDRDPRGIADLRATVTLWQDSRGAGLWEIEYHAPYTVDARRAEIMHRTFRAIDAYSRRDEARHGPPVDAAAFILRAGAALRASCYLLDADDRGPAGGTYRAEDYRTIDTPAAADYLRRTVARWREANPTPAPSAT